MNEQAGRNQLATGAADRKPDQAASQSAAGLDEATVKEGHIALANHKDGNTSPADIRKMVEAERTGAGHSSALRTVRRWWSRRALRSAVL